MSEQSPHEDWTCPECMKGYAELEEMDSCFRSHFEKENIIPPVNPGMGNVEVKIMAKDEVSKKKNAPIKKIRVAGVTLTFWENEGEKGKFLTCKPERSYKDKDGEWQTSDSYMPSDLDNLAVAVAEGQRYARIEYPLSKKHEE